MFGRRGFIGSAISACAVALGLREEKAAAAPALNLPEQLAPCSHPNDHQMRQIEAVGDGPTYTVHRCSLCLATVYRKGPGWPSNRRPPTLKSSDAERQAAREAAQTRASKAPTPRWALPFHRKDLKP